MGIVKLIDVPASVRNNEIVTIERPSPVAKSMLTRLKYRGEGHGRYILESEKEEFFANDEPEATPEPVDEPEATPEPVDEPEVVTDEPVNAEEPKPAPKRKRTRKPKTETK